MYIIDYNETSRKRMEELKDTSKILVVTRGIDGEIDNFLSTGDILIEVSKFRGYSGVYFEIERKLLVFSNTKFIGISDNSKFEELLMSLRLTDMNNNSFRMEGNIECQEKIGQEPMNKF